MKLLAWEVGALFRQRSTLWLLILLSTLVAAVFLQGLGERLALQAEVEEVTVAERSRWLGQPPKNPHSAAHYGVWVFKSSPPLAVLDPGVEPYTGRAIRIEAHRHNDAIARAIDDRAHLARSSAGSVADMLGIVVPIIAILMAYAAFAADRERGTLRMALGNGTRAINLVSARFVAMALIISGIIAIPTLIAGSAGILVLGGDGNDWMGLFFWILSYCAYAWIFLGIASVLSLTLRTAMGALVTSLVIWACLCIVIPRLVTSAVEAQVPMASYQLTQRAIEEDIKAYNRADLHAARQQAILGRYAAGSENELPVDLRGTMLHEREQHDYAVFDRHLGRFMRRLNDQDRAYGVVSGLSPLLALQSFSQSIIGTNYRQHTAFLGSAEMYRRTLSDTMNLNLVANPQREGNAYLAAKAVWRLVPPFAQDLRGLPSRLAEASLATAWLLLWLVGLVGALFVTARRLQP